MVLADRPMTCRRCRFFDDDPTSLERSLPGLTILGSALSSTRGDAGLCVLFDRFQEPLPAAACPSFTLRDRPETESPSM
jgi:hypothetical protein